MNNNLNNQNNNRRQVNNNRQNSSGNRYNNQNNSGNYRRPNNINSNQKYNYDNITKVHNSYTPVRRTVPYQYKRRRKTSFAVKYGVRLLIFLFFFVVVGGITLALFFLNLTRISSASEISYTVNIPKTEKGKEKINTSNVRLSYDVGFANERYYFPINDIMDNMGFVIAGSENDYSFIRENPKEYIKLKIGTNIVYINDEEYHLNSPSFLDKDNKIYVPLEFLQNTFGNLNFTFDDKNKNHITVDVQKIPETQSCFRIRQTVKLDEPKEQDAPYFSTDPIKFTADLSEYEKYFNPPADKTDEYIVLINQTHPLIPQDYIPPDLVDVVDTRKDGRETQQLRLYPEKALEAFLTEARAHGFTNISVTSAYRSYDSQVQTFNSELERMKPIYGETAEEMTAKAVAYPGQSEHQSGLSLDMHSLSAAAQNFGNEPDGKWLAENAHYFGFIVRYPDGKTDITGIQYEPWHFRYVGRNYATKIYESGLCFEEYYEQFLKK